ncbi:uncharacterized protein LOC129858168 isoform X1 [Salvelinus fontinalis]|uniref:uncharacterized protein LOC129858168 isoform X1 n=1 Tax=Salvelinus fontinalis TaxID=8038 RepID=UPI002486ACC2|nr:uncharacterized protein LOC129858168 isoform X1 [Salvelinus fontinalis]
MAVDLDTEHMLLAGRKKTAQPGVAGLNNLSNGNPANQNTHNSFVQDSRRPDEFDFECVVNSKFKNSKVWFCEKCRFLTTDFDDYSSHIMEHAVMRFYCFYCNHVSYSEAELNHHVEQHTRVHPFKCQFCDYRAVKKDYVEMHMKRIHNAPPEKVSSALPRGPKPASLPSALPRDPTLSGILNTRVAPLRTKNITTRVDEGRPMDGTLDANILPKVEVELLAPLNEPIQHNRPLTVSFPEVGTIPPGCLVELVEVKTVNGTKELKLRLVSQQSNGSVMKACRTTTSQNATLCKSSMSNATPTREKPVKKRTCTGNISTRQINDQKQKDLTTAPSTNGIQLKKHSEELLVMVKDVNQPFEIKKEEVKEENCDSVQKSERLHSFTAVSSVSMMGNVNGTKSPFVAPAAMSSFVLCNPRSSTLVIPTPTNQPKEDETCHVADSITSGWTQSENPLVDDVPGPKGFPVISAVFSLSSPQLLAVALRTIALGNNSPSATGEQGNVKNSLILTPAKTTAVCKGHEHKINPGNTDMAPECLSSVHAPQMIPKTCHQVQSAQCSRHTQSLTSNPLSTKGENNSVTIKLHKKTVLNMKKSPPKVAKKTVNTRDSWIGQIDTEKGSVPRHWKSSANKRDISGRLSSCLKLSLKRIRVEEESSLQRCTPELNQRRKKRRRRDMVSGSKTFTHLLDTTGDRVIICPTPLKEDQLVKQPGPNQPVVVLNHPKPLVLRGRLGMETIPDIGPTCHIMKMKLSKVMGHTYEVIGCTVKASP